MTWARLVRYSCFSALILGIGSSLAAMQIDAAQHVLDLGCGTGVAARGLAQRKAFVGKVMGIDLSPYLIAAAQRLSEAEGAQPRITFQVGDSHSLALPDQQFDAVIAHTLISHVDQPLGVLREIARLVKPGGMVGIFDGDYASLTFSHEDSEQGKAFDDVLQQALITHPRVMRQMPALLRLAGLELVTSFSYILAEIGKADFWAPAIESFRRLLPQSGLMTEAQMNAWANARLQESTEGVFFGASNYYSYVARRP
jgi:ubiquinone/menaquinone biosynthesis C-methylase UbiE